MSPPRSAIAALAAAGVLVACAGRADFAPTAGDCLRVGEEDPAGRLTELTVVACDEPHELEVFHTFELEPSQVAGEARVAAVADGCLGEAFAAYVGEPAAASPLELLPLPPSSEQVADGDRTVRCTVRPPGGGTTTGSVRTDTA